MFATLIVWVIVGDIHSMGVRQVPANTCERQAAEAVTDDYTRAAVCVYDRKLIPEAIQAGSCRLMINDTAERSQVYFCNGRLPAWN